MSEPRDTTPTDEEMELLWTALDWQLVARVEETFDAIDKAEAAAAGAAWLAVHAAADLGVDLENLIEIVVRAIIGINIAASRAVAPALPELKEPPEVTQPEATE